MVWGSAVSEPKVSEKRYMVGIVIPALDRTGHQLAASEVETWTKRALDELTACFGGATSIPAPGTNVVPGPTGELLKLFEPGQTLILSACSDQDEYESKRPQIKHFVVSMQAALR